VTVCCSSSFVRRSSFVVRRSSFVVRSFVVVVRFRRRSFSSSSLFVAVAVVVFVVVGDGRVPVVVVCEFVGLSHSFIDGFVWWLVCVVGEDERKLKGKQRKFNVRCESCACEAVCHSQSRQAVRKLNGIGNTMSRGVLVSSFLAAVLKICTPA